MSTKIYDAYLWCGEDLPHLMSWLFRLRTRYERWVIDQLRVHATSTVSQLVKDIREAVASGTSQPLNIAAQVIVLVSDCDSLYVKFAGVPDKLLPNRSRLFRDYHYQNQTDRPRGVSDRVWAAREETWDRLLGHGPTWADNGLIFDLAPAGCEYEIANAVRRK